MDIYAAQKAFGRGRRLDRIDVKLKDGVSMEEEHRRILRESLGAKPAAQPMSFKEFLLTMPDVGDDSLFERSKEMPREIDWS